MKKAKKSKAPFTVKQRKGMIEDLEKHDYSSVVETAIERLRSGLHLELSESRHKFVCAICDHENQALREHLVACIMGMVLAFIDLYKECMKGKRFANFQQEWMVNTNNYFTSSDEQGSSAAAATSVCTDRQEQHKLLRKVTEAASIAGYTMNIQDERIIVSTLCYTVYDLMVERVKEYKVHLSPESDASGACVATGSESAITLKENDVNLYRYGGFALHSMIEKRKRKLETGPKDSCVQLELKFLENQVVQKDQWNELPTPILDLKQGGLHMVKPTMLPFLRQLVEKVASKVNDDMRQEYGHQVIKLAKQELESDSELHALFDKCSIHAGNPPKESENKLFNEFCMKVFHARVNGYMVATEEIELEKAGKAVKVEQCLRDELKTFSALKGR